MTLDTGTFYGWGAVESPKPLGGSFHFPPPLRNADEIIVFWTRVAIPHEALARLRALYFVNYGNLQTEWHRHAWNWYAGWAWEESNPRPTQNTPGALAEWARTEQLARAAYEQALHARTRELPAELARTDVTPMFRAAAMLRSVSDLKLPWKERKKVAEYPLEFSDGTRTVAEVATETGLIGLARRFVHADNYVLDGIVTSASPLARTTSEPESAGIKRRRRKRIIV